MYLDLNERAQNSSSVASTESSRMPLWEQIVVYAGLVLGVLFSSAVTDARAGQALSFDISPAQIGISLFVALVITPTVFQKLSANPDSPLLVRFSLFVQNGAFWPVLFDAIGTSMTSMTSIG